MPGQGNIILIAVTIIHYYHGHCSANTLKNVSFIKKEKIPRSWRATVDFWPKRKKKSKGLLNVEFTPRFLALRNTSMRLQKYTPSSQRFPSHFSLIYLRVVFTLISDKAKKPLIAFLRKEAFPSFAGYPLMDIWLAALSEPGEVRVHS